MNFSPAVSDDAKKRIGREIRSWRINCRSDKTLSDLAYMFNPHVRGWTNYCVPRGHARLERREVISMT